MKNKLFLLLLTSPLIVSANAGKKAETIMIVSFMFVSLGSIFIYYLIWKKKNAHKFSGKDKSDGKYIYKTVKVVQNGRTYFKHKKIRVDTTQAEAAKTF
jgi:hypothetical protein